MVMVADIWTTKHKVVLVANFYRVRKVTYEKMCKLSHELQTLMLTLYIKHSTVARCAQCTLVLVTSHDAGCL